MGSEPNGASRSSGRHLLNSYAMVIYIPAPLGRFLDDLRMELVPSYRPHAHISILPPRPLRGSEPEAREQMRQHAVDGMPFDIELSDLAVFPVTDVVYLEIGEGQGELHRMHEALNIGALAYQEPFLYHPHVTLAQDFDHQDLGKLEALARRRWAEYAGPRRFRAERMSFVQNRTGNIWFDVDEYVLGAVPVK
jgi:2'-5' RNA ligase